MTEWAGRLFQIPPDWWPGDPIPARDADPVPHYNCRPGVEL